MCYSVALLGLNLPIGRAGRCEEPHTRANRDRPGLRPLLSDEESDKEGLMVWEPWWIVERVRGYVDSRVPTSDGEVVPRWAPVFRSRRLNEGYSFRVQPFSEARLNRADLVSFRFCTGWCELVISVDNYKMTWEGHQKVFDMRSRRVYHDVAKALGLINTRVELDSGYPTIPIGARG